MNISVKSQLVSPHWYNSVYHVRFSSTVLYCESLFTHYFTFKSYTIAVYYDLTTCSALLIFAVSAWIS